MDRSVFFRNIRNTLYAGGVPASAVKSLDLFLDFTDGKGFPAEHVAYMMATAYHEVGPALVPKRESLNYSIDGLLSTFGRHRISEADARRLGRKPGEKSVPLARQKEIANTIYGGEWGRKNLGNTEPNDGWDFRGGGYPQATGRANFARLAMLTNVPLVNAPHRITEPAVAAIATIEAMTVGLYTGKALSDYHLPAQFAAARAIINADVKKNGEKIAGHARQFLVALNAGKYEPRRLVVDAVKPRPKVEPKPEPKIEPVDVEPEKLGPNPATPGMIGAGLVAGLVAAGVAAYNWLAAFPCEYLNLFCGN